MQQPYHLTLVCKEQCDQIREQSMPTATILQIYLEKETLDIKVRSFTAENKFLHVSNATYFKYHIAYNNVTPIDYNISKY